MNEETKRKLAELKQLFLDSKNGKNDIALSSCTQLLGAIDATLSAEATDKNAQFLTFSKIFGAIIALSIHYEVPLETIYKKAGII